MSDEDESDDLLSQAIALCNADQYDAAQQRLDELPKTEPTNSSAYFVRGHSYRLRNQPELAIDEFDRAQRFGCSDGRLHSMRGLLYHDLGCYEEAVDDLTIAVAADPSDDLCLCMRGDALQR